MSNKQQIDTFVETSDWLFKETAKLIKENKKNPTPKTQQDLIHIRARIEQWLRETGPIIEEYKNNT